jgi:hypothetical protein
MPRLFEGLRISRKILYQRQVCGFRKHPINNILTKDRNRPLTALISSGIFRMTKKGEMQTTDHSACRLRTLLYSYDSMTVIDIVRQAAVTQPAKKKYRSAIYGSWCGLELSFCHMVSCVQARQKRGQGKSNPSLYAIGGTPSSSNEQHHRSIPHFTLCIVQ